jgi:putative RNA 2'-phosphotransferase
MDRKTRQQQESLCRFLVYLLGRAPDEFGLVLDPEGWIDFKHLLQALSEEKDWKGVTQNKIRDLSWAVPNCPLEIEEKRLRVRSDNPEGWVPPVREERVLPTLLYLAIRRRPYRVYMTEGMVAPEGQEIVLARTPEMARRIAHRRDPKAILVEVNPATASDYGARFLCYGDHLVVAEWLPKECLFGPPPKEEEAPPPKKKKPEQKEPEAPHPDSFKSMPWIPQDDRLLARSPEEERQLLRKERSRKRVGWKDEAKKETRRKRNPPPEDY